MCLAIDGSSISYSSAINVVGRLIRKAVIATISVTSTNIKNVDRFPIIKTSKTKIEAYMIGNRRSMDFQLCI